MDIGPVADGHIVPDEAGLVISHMEAGEVLHIAALPDLYIADIPPGHHPRPERGIPPHPHIPGEEDLGGHEALLMKLGALALENIVF